LARIRRRTLELYLSGYSLVFCLSGCAGEDVTKTGTASEFASGSAVLKPAPSNSGETAQDLCSQADELARQGKYPDAIEHCNQAVQVDPSLTRAYLSRAIAYDQMDQYEKALADFDRALSLLPQDDRFRPEYHYNRGMCLHRMKRYEAAVKDFDEALQSADQASYYYMRGKSLRALRKSKEALLDFDKSIALEKGDDLAASLLQRGLVHKDMGQLKNALHDIDSAIQVYEEGFDGDRQQLKGSKHGLPACYFERGNLYKMMGNEKLASADLKRAADFEYRPDIEHRLPISLH
jgi:tetratricopeptide (TPR) repeat protein